MAVSANELHMGVRAEPSQSAGGVKAVGALRSHLHCSLGHRALGNAPHDLPPQAFNDAFSSTPFLSCNPFLFLFFHSLNLPFNTISGANFATV